MDHNQQAVMRLFDQVAGVEAIDKCVAKEFGAVSALTHEEVPVWAGLLLYLSFMQRNGHSCVYLANIAGQQFFEEVPSYDVGDEQVGTLTSKEGVRFPSLTPLIKIVKAALNNTQIAALFVYVNGRFYSRRYYEFEQEVAKGIVERTVFEALSEGACERVKALWPSIFPTHTLDKQDWQQVAVAKCLVQRFAVINGGPGTGKTYTVLRLLLALQACNENANIVLAAPTGKAQQRMTESILNSIDGLRGRVDDSVLNRVPVNAVTLHRLLGLREYTVATKHHHHNPLNLDVLIVDEASMVDLALMTRIMRALPAHAKLYFIGDAEQLPAVELGNVLEQLVCNDNGVGAPEESPQRSFLGNGAVPSKIRQHIATLCPHLPLLPVNEHSKSYIATLQAPQRFEGQVADVATAILQGDAVKTLNTLTLCNEKTLGSKFGAHYLKSGVQLRHQRAINVSFLQQLAKESFLPLFNAKSAKAAIGQLKNVRWLTPVRNGNLGVEGLNSLVFESIKHKIQRRQGHFYQGQPIMIVKNHHPLRLSNGEVGVIWPDEQGKLYAWFEVQDGQLRSISLSRVPQFETVYAMTIHKSQGSEFTHVVLVLPEPDSEKAAGLFHRGLVYTGLTRAKEGCLIIADDTALSSMVTRVDKRFSGLSDAIAILSE